MAGNNMNFSASLRLNASQFKKGIADVQRSLKGLQSTFLTVAGALGAGLGLARIVSNLKDTAVQLSVAENVLENVSRTNETFVKGMNEVNVVIDNYSSNLNYAKEMSRKYSQDLTTMINSFSQFHAAFDGTNLSMEQQKEIFEQLTRASAYYHMSAERTRDMFTAIIQMASKGKITAEELRRQLGNNLPGAFNIMARALGLSNAQLDDMMRKGKILAADALPAFANELKKITEGAHFDSLQMSMNRLKNTWTELTKSTGFQNFYKGVIDGANNTLNYLRNNFKSLAWGIGVGAFGGIATKNTIKSFAAIKDASKAMKVELDKAYTSLDKIGEQLRTKYNYTDNKGFADYKAPSMALFDTKTFEKERDLAKQQMNGLVNNKKSFLEMEDDANKAIKAVQHYNELLIQTQKLNKKLYGKKGFITKEEIKEIKEYNKQLEVYRNKMMGTDQAIRKTAAAGRVLKKVFSDFWNAMYASVIGLAVGTVLGVITKIIASLSEHKQKLKEIAQIENNYLNDQKQAAAAIDQQGAQLLAYQKIMNDASDKSDAALERRVKALNKVNELMGSNYTLDALDKTKKAYEDINKEVDKWIEKTKLQAKIQIASNAEATAEGEIKRLEAEQRELAEKIQNPKTFWEQFQRVSLRRRFNRNSQEIDQWRAVLADARDDLEGYTKQLLDLTKTNQPTGGGKSLKGIPKMMEDYVNAIDELNASLSQGIIAKKEYDKELDKLIIDTWRKVAKTGKLDIKSIIGKVDKGETLSTVEEWYYDIAQAAKAAAQRVLERDIDDMLSKAMTEFKKDLDKELKEVFEDRDKVIETDLEIALKTKRPNFEARNPLLDYDKDTSEILDEEAKKQRDWAKEIEGYIDDIKGKYENIEEAGVSVKEELAAWEREMVRATAAAESLEAAMRYEKIKEDIKDLNKTIADSYASGLKGLASDMDRIVKGWESIKDAMDDEDTTYWDKFMLVFNEIVQIFDAVVGVIDTFNKIQEASAKLAGAELAQNAALIEMQQKKVNLERELFIWKQKNAGMTNAAIAAEIAEATASRSNASAKASEAVAGATASGAKLAFPWNLAAIAVGVATVLAALTGGKNIKFANGGIVGGNSYSGDNQLARVNSGELIMNRGQQAHLWNFIKHGSNGVGGEVQFKIRGCDLIGAINNEQSRRKG